MVYPSGFWAARLPMCMSRGLFFVSHHFLNRRQVLGAVGAAFSTLPISRAYATPTLVLTKIASDTEVGKIEALLRAAYARLGYEVFYEAMPSERSLVESDAGRVDGETARVSGLESTYVNLRRVDVVLAMDPNAVFIFGPEAGLPKSPEQWSKLKSVGIVKGRKVAEAFTAGWPNVVPLTSYLSGVQMLRAGRIDAFVGRVGDTTHALMQEGLPLQEFPSLVVLRTPLFHYLNKKNEALLPGLTKELRRMKGRRETVLEAWEASK